MNRRVLATVAFLTSGLPASQAGAQETLLLREPTIVDGRGGTPVTGHSVLIREGRIVAIGPVDRLDTGGARIIDLRGKYLLPGLIDTHLHSPPDSGAVAARMAWLFRNGITTARDMAADAHILGAVAKATEPADVASARLRYMAFWAGPSFYQVDKRPIGSTQGKPLGTVPWFLAVDSAEGLDRHAGEAAALGAHALKLYTDLPAPVFQAAVTAAHRRGLLTASHAAVFPQRPSAVIAAGVDAISHSALLVWEAVDSLPSRFHTEPHTNFGPIGPYARVAPDDPRIITVLDSMQRRGTILDATVLAIEKGISPEASAWSLRVTALARQRGVTISTGTDRPEAPDPNRQPALFDEIELLVRQAGFTPSEAITAATLNGARAIGIAADYGTIELGKVADLIVLDADPTADIANLRRISATIKAGMVYTKTP